VFVVAGDGPHEAECRRLAPGGTIFLGRVVGDELSAAYASSDIQLFPSTTDTFGNVLLEGMASGLAIVAADAAPTREILADGGGITVAPRAPDRLAAAVLELVRVPALRAQLRQSALQNAVGRSWDAVFDSLVADYARVAGHGPPHLPDDPLAAAALSVTTTMDVLVTRPPPERSEIMTK
jgi:glycosyltransferase involved in cell wall biosynthesis